MSMNQWEAENSTQQHAHSNSVRELAMSRREAKDSLTQAEGLGVPPFQAIVNPNPPTKNNLHGGLSEMPRWGSALRYLHASVLEYWDELRAYRSRAPELWDKPLGKVPYPVQGDWEVIRVRYDRNHKVRGVEYDTRPISLESLGEWRLRQVKLAREYPERYRRNSQIKERIEKVHLPPVAAQKAYEQMNDVLEEIGLAAEVRKTTASDREAGVPDDIDDWQVDDGRNR